MASTWKELFDDFMDYGKIYTEKMDVTEVSFMRMCSKGMQKFQKATELKEKVFDFPYVLALDGYPLSTDVYRIIEIKDPEGFTVLPQAWEQYNRNVELNEAGYMETPVDYSTRLRAGGYSDENARMVSQFNRILYVYPNEPATVTYLSVWYIPELHVFSSNDTLWSAWFPINTNFNTQFTTTGPDDAVAPYEDAFVDYAMHLYLASNKHKDAIFYMQKFQTAIETAKSEKPVLFQEAVADYHMSPFS